MSIHSSDAKRTLAQYHIGSLVDHHFNSKMTEEIESEDKYFLHPKKWKSISLVSVQSVSKDTKLFRFALDHSDKVLGLPTGQHVYVRLNRRTKPTSVVQRAYTPLSRPEDPGFVDILVKYPCLYATGILV